MIDLDLTTAVIIGILSGWVSGVIITTINPIANWIVKKYNIDSKWKTLIGTLISGGVVLIFILILVAITK